jgi:hypothetical protein
VRSTSEPAVLVLTADRLCAHVGPVSKVPAINPTAIIEANGDSDLRDPVAGCVSAILREMPELRGRCLDILEAVPVKVASQFRQANAAFEQRNATAGLVAPPPPKSHTV